MNNEPLVICDNLTEHKKNKYVRCNRVGDLWVCPVCKKSWNDKDIKR